MDRIGALAKRFSAEGIGWHGYMRMGLPAWLVPYTVDWVVSAILEHAPTAQGIAFRGVSGALIAPVVAYKMCLNPLAVRKRSEWSHDGSTQHDMDRLGSQIKRYVIVDDFIDSGATVRQICAYHDLRLAKPLGVFQYSRRVGHERKSLQLNSGTAIAVHGCVPPDYANALGVC